MPVIAMISPKGGAGKSTANLILACEFARSANSVAILDADPNHPVATWEALCKSDDGLPIPENIEVISDVTEKNIVDQIEQSAEKHDFVFVDLEGTANLAVSYAITFSDLVIIPVQASPLDAREAAKAILLIETAEKQTRRSINHRILWARNNTAITTKLSKNIVKEFGDQFVPDFQTQLLERVAYKLPYRYGGTIYDLNEEIAEAPSAKALKDARANSLALAKEVFQVIQDPLHGVHLTLEQVRALPADQQRDYCVNNLEEEEAYSYLSELGLLTPDELSTKSLALKEA